MADEINRVFIWSISRSLSTVLAKCLSFVDGIQFVNQPYASAHFNGPEEAPLELNQDNPAVTGFVDVYRIIVEAMRSSVGVDNRQMSYRWIRDELLELPYPGKKILLCKDQAPYLQGKHDMLPRNFKYSFLIRHPAKVLLSYKKYITNYCGTSFDLRALPDKMFPRGRGFKELYDLYEYVRANIDPEPTVMDADDLQGDPAGLLPVFCEEMGIPYSDELLTWEAGNDVTSTWIQSKSMIAGNTYMKYFGRVFESSQFDKPTPIPALESLPEDVQECVKFSMEYYENMHRHRIRPINQRPTSNTEMASS